MDTALLRGERVRLAAVNPETDAEIVAAWSRDGEFQSLLNTDAPTLWTARALKAELAEGQGKDEAQINSYAFVIRTLAEDRLIGFIDIDVKPWSQRNGWIAIGIGPREYWGKGYGTDAMRVLQRFAFTELNLDRLTLNVFAYNERAQRSYLKAGFQVEGRQRQRLRRGRQYYDMVFMGLLCDEWRGREWRSRESGEPASVPLSGSI